MRTATSPSRRICRWFVPRESRRAHLRPSPVETVKRSASAGNRRVSSGCHGRWSVCMYVRMYVQPYLSIPISPRADALHASARPHRSCMHAGCSGPSMHAHDRAPPTDSSARRHVATAPVSTRRPLAPARSKGSAIVGTYIPPYIRMYLPVRSPAFTRARRAFEMTLPAWGRAVPVLDGSPESHDAGARAFMSKRVGPFEHVLPRVRAEQARHPNASMKGTYMRMAVCMYLLCAQFTGEGSPSSSMQLVLSY